MGPVFLAVTVSLIVYLAVVALIPRHVLQGSSAYTRHMISRLREQVQQGGTNTGLEAFTRAQDDPGDNPLVRAFLLMPGMQRAVPRIQRAGLWKSLDQFVLGVVLIFLFALFASARFGIFGLPIALVVTWLVASWFLSHRIAKRKRNFLNQFPDALDSIVRSIRAGYPLGNAITMIGDNMSAPVGPEFKRVSDEVAYGWTLSEALNRLSERVDEPDVRFFTVVLNVQQESGGNLSEVLSNLSGVLRSRKQLRLKIKALSSEGRATAWILGSLPFFVFSVIYFISPQHLNPLFETSTGHIIIAAVLGMVGAGMLIVRQIINMEV